MFIKKLLQRALRYRMRLRRKSQEKQLLKKTNSKLAKLLKITRDIQ